jgi:hypothetical protein
MKHFGLLLTLLSLSALGQTRLISHKSHSGSAATFSTAFNNNLFDIDESNFGEPGSEMRFVVDSVILLPDNRAVVISHEEDVWVTYPKSAVLLTGRDTLYNDAMFSKRHSQDSIKRELSRQGSHNPSLINYDNDKTKKNAIPAVPEDNDTGLPNKPVLVFALALLSMLFGLVSLCCIK